MHNSQRASENAEFSMQSTPAPEAEGAKAAIAEETVADVWAEWPYCWAIEFYKFARRRFHSFHQSLFEWRLACSNRRAQVKFRARYWRRWQRDEEDEVLGLRLV
jgi:hypothetical protein